MTSAPEQTAGSVSKITCLASVRGRGEARVALYRHLAPLTVNAVMRVLPSDSRVNIQPALVSIFTDLRVGVEKPKLSFVRGEVAYLPSGGLICVFLKDAKSDRPLNPLGSVEEGMQVFDSIRPGDVVHLAAAPGTPLPE